MKEVVGGMEAILDGEVLVDAASNADTAVVVESDAVTEEDTAL